MPDIEKVIKGLECCTDIFTKCDICPYWRHPNIGLPECMKLRQDALEVIKEQKDNIETQGKLLKIKQDQIVNLMMINAKKYKDNHICKKCYKELLDPWDWCPYCGKETPMKKLRDGIWIKDPVRFVEGD